MSTHCGCGGAFEPGVTKHCHRFVSWWDGEYEGSCELQEGHDGDHYDGLSWYNDDGECTDHAHIDA